MPRRCLAVLAVLMVSACTRPQRLEPQSPPEWKQIAPGGDTVCGLGTPYRFFHRPGTDPDRLLVYFQGGGACWNWVSCSGLFDTEVTDDEVAPFRGIFDRTNPANPLRDVTVVFVPYCTGDVHIGDAERRYADGARPVLHRGDRNVAAVLDWLASRRLRPGTVVVAGTSAGSYGALFHLPAIARLFPDADVIMLGDSGVPLLSDNRAVLASWGADRVFAARWGEPAGERPLLDAYRQAARLGDRVRLAQITADRDAVQSAFYLISGSHGWRPATYSLLADASRAAPSLRTFIVDGADHGLLPTDAFYRYRVDDMLLRDWLAALIAGDPVDDVRCGACAP